MRTIDWVDGEIVIIDQVALPHEVNILRIAEVDELVGAIVRLAVRGAPALGAAGALGVVLAMDQGAREGWDDDSIGAALSRLRSARPTAVNLAWGVDRVVAHRPAGRDAVLAEALAVLDQDALANRAIGERGADLLIEMCGEERPIRIHTHCNAGALACVEWGTALGVVHVLHQRGHLGRVLADETRPLLQGPGSRHGSWIRWAPTFGL